MIGVVGNGMTAGAWLAPEPIATASGEDNADGLPIGRVVPAVEGQGTSGEAELRAKSDACGCAFAPELVGKFACAVGCEVTGDCNDANCRSASLAT